MNNYHAHKPDFSLFPHAPRPAAYEQKLFGWRQSVHSGWIQCEPNGSSEYDDWPHEGADFLCRLGEEDGHMKIKVVAESREGKVINEVFIDPSDFDDAQRQLINLEPESVNLMFDPVPWVSGKRNRKTRFGWVTLSGIHPLGLFPEPVIYWAVGPHAYQALIPWHMPVKLKDSCKASVNAAPFTGSGSAASKPDDFLFMPGSIIHAGRLSAFTALVKYDMFSVSEVGDPEAFWTQY